MAGFAGGSDSDLDFAGSPSHDSEGGGDGQDHEAARALRRPLQKWRCFLVLSSRGAPVQHYCADDIADAQVADDHVTVCGAILAEAYRVVPVQDELDADACFLRDTYGWRCVGRGVQVFGWITYPIMQYARLLEPVSVPVASSYPQMWALVSDKLCMWGDVKNKSEDEHVPLHSVIHGWSSPPCSAPATHCVYLPAKIAQTVARGTMSCAHVVAITRRTNRRTLFVFSEPHRRVLQPYMHLPSQYPPEIRPRLPASVGLRGQFRVYYVLACLDASRDLKSIRMLWDYAPKFVHLLELSEVTQEPLDLLVSKVVL